MAFAAVAVGGPDDDWRADWHEHPGRIFPVLLASGERSPWFTTLLYRRQRGDKWEYRMPTEDEQLRYEIGNML